jgi:hypothetical protein
MSPLFRWVKKSFLPASFCAPIPCKNIFFTNRILGLDIYLQVCAHAPQAAL